MKFRIEDANRELIYIADNGEEELLYKFIDDEKLKDTKYTLYAYADMVDTSLYIKFGEAKKQSIFSRYNSTGHHGGQRMIMIWESDKGDKEIHSKLKVRAKNGRGYSAADQRVHYLAYLLNHRDEFNSGKYDTNVLENEFRCNMPESRVAAIERVYNIDMTVMKQIAELLIEDNVQVYN